MGRSPPPAAGGPHLRNLPQGLLARRPRLPPRASESLLQEALQLDLGLVSHGGSTRNNIVLEHKNYWNASILVDPSQPAGAAERYKMIQLYYNREDKREQIHGFVSPDGFRWRPVDSNPFLSDGPFDSHNTLL